VVTYKRKINSQYKDYSKMFVYLTPDGERPTDEEWITLNYTDVVGVLENVCQSRYNFIGKDESLLIKNYINTIKKNIIMDQELVNLCNSIYNKHRRALDLIFENREDVISQASNNCKSILSRTPGVILDESSKSKVYVKFRTEGLNDTFSGVDAQYYYYQFEIREDHITVMLEYHKNKEEELDEDILSRMSEFKGKFPKNRDFPKKDWVWFRVWTEKTDDIFDEGWMKDMIVKILKRDGSESLIADK
jgi:hypothetical protein